MHSQFEFENKHLNLAYTLECGQCFRWKRLEDGYYYGVAGPAFVRMRQDGIRFKVEMVTEDEVDPRGLFERYFGLDEDARYQEIVSTLKTDEAITRAISRYYGLRLLNQPPFEVLISFILSANNNIPAVARTVQAISKKYGKTLVLGRYRGYTFPAPAELLKASEDELNLELGAEYRGKYIVQTTRKIVEQNFSFDALRELPYDWAHGQLTVFPGVGRNVADWVLLFSLGKREAFPLDTWVTRAMESFYFNGQKTLPKEIHKMAAAKWREQAGYANEFLYMYARNHLNRGGISGS
ncbi:MAG TPA: DNA glycosylase [Chloroflexia bacterium]|nr:DNA glycosylase [Chloroflexia bacterium]